MKETDFLIEVCCMKHLPGVQTLKINTFFAGFVLQFASGFEIENSKLFLKSVVVILQGSCMILLVRWSGFNRVLLVKALN